MRTKVALVLTMTSATLLSKAQADDFDTYEDMSFVDEHGNIALPTLINGTPAPEGLFKASVRASMGGSSCTATVIGEQALLIASHCVSHGASATFRVEGKSYTSVCSRAPLYRRGVDHDLALCKITTKVTGIEYERINMDNSLYNVGSTLLLTGYGCTRPGGKGGNDGIYRIGDSKITRMPGGSTYDITTQAGGALCFGDSGGPAFFYLDPEMKNRIVVSANSKGNISTTSYLTSTSTQASKDFINSWSAANNVKICGVHTDATGCRFFGKNSPPPPGPSPSPIEPDALSDECKLMAENEAVKGFESCLLSDKPDLVKCDEHNDLIQACYATK